MHQQDKTPIVIRKLSGFTPPVTVDFVGVTPQDASRIRSWIVRCVKQGTPITHRQFREAFPTLKYVVVSGVYGIISSIGMHLIKAKFARIEEGIVTLIYETTP